MSSKIILKKSSVTGRVPTVSDLDYGELALNYTDGRLYYKTSNNAISSLGGNQNFTQIDRQSYTATAGQTVFSVTYSIPYVDVYINGIHLSDEDYAATSGTAITLVEAAAEGDQVDVIGYSGGIISPALKTDGDLLVYNGTTQIWENFPQSAVTVGNTDKVDGYHASESNVPSTVVTRDSSGFVNLEAINLNTSYAGLGDVGRLTWDDTDGTAHLGLKGGLVVLPVGQTLVQRITNVTGGTILRGRAIYVSGSLGNRATVSYASCATEATSSKTLGILTENISDNQSGFVVTEGFIRELDTSGLTEGAAIWLSTNGQLTSTRPTQPNHGVFLGYCLKTHASTGIIYVKVQNGYELEELHNVLINGVANYDVLMYDSTTSLWKNQQINLGTHTVGNYVATLGSSGGTITVTGSGSETAAVNIDLPNTGVTANTYGTASAVPVITVDAKGRITNLTTTPVAGLSGVSYNSTTGVLTLSTSAGTTYTPDLGVGTSDSPTFAALSTTGDLTVGGNLIVNGSTTTLNSTTLNVDDVNITVASGALNAASANGAGLTVDGANATFTYTSADDRWNLNKNLNVGTVYGALSGNASTASTLQTTRTIALSGDVNGSILFNGSSDVTIATTIQPNSVALGTDTTGNYMLDVVSGSGISISHTQGEGSTATISHADTSSVANLTSDNTGNTFIQDISLTFDTFGHVTGASVATGSVVIGDGAMTVTAGTEMTGGGQLGTANQTGATSVTLNHANVTRTDTTSTASPARNGTFTVVDSVTTNARGHVTAVNVKTVTLPEFEIVSISKALTLSTTWQDTGISSTDIATGSYMIQIESVSDNTVGGGHYSEYYTGVMSWFSGATNSAVIDEITLHRAGAAPNSGIIFLRTQRNSSGVLKLQIAGNTANTGAYTYNFKFRRMI